MIRELYDALKTRIEAAQLGLGYEADVEYGSLQDVLEMWSVNRSVVTIDPSSCSRDTDADILAVYAERIEFNVGVFVKTADDPGIRCMELVDAITASIQAYETEGYVFTVRGWDKGPHTQTTGQYTITAEAGNR